MDPRQLLQRAARGESTALGAVGDMSMSQAEALDRAMGCRASKKHCRKSLDLAPTDGCSCDACVTARAAEPAP